jgi:uncharacterized membrane protein YkvA (DUF1232 family)
MGARTPLKLGLGVLNLWPFLPVASRAPLYGRLLWELARDDRVPWSRKALLAFAAAYVVSPIDFIPDFIPVISRIDDMAVIVISIDLFLESVPHELMIEKMYQLGIDGRELERDLESMRRVIPRPIRHAARRLPDLVDRTGKLIRARFAGQWPRLSMRSSPKEAMPE